MALINCPECKKLISDTADFCPHCGFKITPEVLEEIKKKQEKEKKNTKIGCFIFIILFFIMVIIGIYEMATMTPEEKRNMTIEMQFDKWDGSHIMLREYIKKHMYDPSSFKHIETAYIDKGEYLVVTTKFRGKNAFGAYIINTVIAKVDLNGNILEILYWGK